MGKIIINNESASISDIDAVYFVAAAARDGRISDDGKSYCFATSLYYKGRYVVVYAKRNKSSDTFTVRDR